jgi:nitroreductase
MEFMDVVTRRKSVRSFTNQTIQEETLSKVLEAARWAPSWANKQSPQFIVVTDKEKIAALAGEFRVWLKQAPVVVVACADPEKSGFHDDMDYFLVDVGIALQQLVLAATDLGLGTCWIGAFDEAAIKRVLGVPENIKVVAYTPLGYPAKEDAYSQRIKAAVGSDKRKPLEQLIHRENW